MKQRLLWVDAAKGWLMLLVILGHTISWHIGRNLINGFDMAAFFFLSGYLFSKDRGFRYTLKRKAKTLLLPYLGFSVILLIFFWIKSVLFHAEFDALQGVASIVAPFSGYWKSSVYGLWFLPCLFFVELFAAAYFAIRSRAIAVTATIVATGGILLLTILTGIVSVWSVLPLAEIFFALGMAARKMDFQKLYHWFVPLAALVCYVALLAANTLLSHGQLFDFSSLMLGIPPLFFLHALTGTVMILPICKWTENWGWLGFIGRNSLYFYGLHYIVLSAASEFLREKAGALPTFVVTVLICAILVWLYNQLKRHLWRKNRND